MCAVLCCAGCFYGGRWVQSAPCRPLCQQVSFCWCILWRHLYGVCEGAVTLLLGTVLLRHVPLGRVSTRLHGFVLLQEGGRLVPDTLL
jgi:hypothetical protein